MSESSIDQHYTTTRRELTFDVSYAAFTRAFESLLGKMDVEFLREISTRSPEEAREQLASFAGSSGFALFQKLDHGGLLTLFTGEPTLATTYVLGNALIAIEMTRHARQVGLYVPLRLHVSETEPGRIGVTYDVPSATLGQFGSPEVDAVASMLDTKVEKLVADAAELARIS
jgi:uncharacterized protein (DUF302 family)